ncbi:uncharacterized protein LOC119683905 [Teleopsis dalmanni]|uniref:uncharacterized protein LOC119679359 n=1 Tax=Teleopsis dalmanni TaxID=139649 RepID=UPI0018CF66D3|nr:uncharacterized protein LOC119679359 [Teleopsis dalmanni]XP_037953719.1 uncharacterized protein LOC119683905 [Teleopsis dalmanni]
MRTKIDLEGKRVRTRQKQLEFFLQFSKEHQSILRGEKDPRAWSELADSLNAMRGPTRSASKWRQTLNHWRNQVRSRAKKARSGGPGITIQLSELECQAMDTFGSSAETGLIELPALGIQSFDDSGSIIIEPKQELLSPVGNVSGPPSTPSAPSCSPNLTAPTFSKRKRVTDDKELSLLRESIKKSREYEERSLAIQEQVLETQQAIASALNNISTAVFQFIELKNKPNYK